MQRIANPYRAVRLRFAPPASFEESNAGIAQLVERNLAKVEVASSRLVSRSRFLKVSRPRVGLFFTDLGRPSDGIGRRSGLKIRRPFKRRTGSIPVSATRK